MKEFIGITTRFLLLLPITLNPFLHYTPGPIEWSIIYFMDSPCPSTKPA